MTPSQESSEKLCAFGCGREPYEGKRLCKQHLDHQRAKMAEYRAERKRLGLCSGCGNPARRLANKKVSTLCQSCRDHVRTIEKKDRSVAKQERDLRDIKKLVKLFYRETGARPKRQTSAEWRRINLWLRYRQRLTLDKICDDLGLKAP